MARRDGRNTTHYWCHPHIPGVSLLRAEFSTFPYVPHLHDTYVIAATEAGSASITCRGQTEVAYPSTIFLSNPREPQAASISGGGRWRYRAFYIADRAAAHLAAVLGLDELPSFITTRCTDAAVTGAILAVHRALEATAGEPTSATARLIDALGSLLERYSAVRCPTIGASDDAVRRVIGVMRERSADRLRLEDLSASLGVSPFQLIALFKRTVGMTPYTYLIQVRLDEARRHLAAGRSIAHAAAASGFYDQSALTRHFKRSYGITPLQFMAAARPLANTDPVGDVQE